MDVWGIGKGESYEDSHLLERLDEAIGALTAQINKIEGREDPAVMAERNLNEQG